MEGPPSDAWANASNLASLYKPIKHHQPGDWLLKHYEPGQTFRQFLELDNTSVAGQTIAVVPLGFKADATELLTPTIEYLELFFGLEVQVIALEEDDVDFYDSIDSKFKRVHQEWGDKQIHTKYLMDLLRQYVTDKTAAVLGLTQIDLYPKESFNFVFGQAHLKDKVGVWSTYRLGEGKQRLIRTIQTATHETLHMLQFR
jgi:archaemetzincin